MSIRSGAACRLAPTCCALLGLLAASCASDHDISRLDQEDIFYQEGTDMVDLLWVVDNSSSMASEQDKVAAGFEQFIWSMGAVDVDFHLGLVTTDMDLDNDERGELVGDPPFLTQDDEYLPKFMERVKLGTEGSDKERGMQAALHALTGASAASTNGGFLRDEAVLALVVVSDENDCSDDNFLPDSEAGSLCYDLTDRLVSVADYIRAFRDVKGTDGHVVASVIVGPEVSEGCEHTWPGHRYMTLAEELDGVIGNICDSDYEQIMDEVGARVAAPIRSFFLSYTPVADSIIVMVDDEEIIEDPDEGWQYDEEYVAVRFHGDYVPEFGSTISINYDIAGE